MNLEEELKELEGFNGEKNNSDLNEIMSNYSKEQIIQVLDKLYLIMALQQPSYHKEPSPYTFWLH